MSKPHLRFGAYIVCQPTIFLSRTFGASTALCATKPANGNVPYWIRFEGFLYGG